MDDPPSPVLNLTINRFLNSFSTVLNRAMLISTKTTAILADRISSESEIFCGGLYLSARWFVLSQAVRKGLQFIILPDRESAEYCSADLYNIVEGDIVFYLPESGKGV